MRSTGNPATQQHEDVSQSTFSSNGIKSTNLSNNQTSTVNIQSRSIINGLMGTFVVLFILHVIAVIGFENGVMFHRFYFDTEANLPSYFSTLLWLISAILIGFIAFFKYQENDRFKLKWLILSVLFFALSIDENAAMHEVFIDPLRNLLNLTGAFRLSWVILGIPFVVLFALYYLPFFLSLSSKMQLRFFISGALFVTGALGVEMIGGYIWTLEDYGNESLAYRICITVEECFEMLAIIYFISTLLAYIKAYRPMVDLNVTIK